MADDVVVGLDALPVVEDVHRPVDVNGLLVARAVLHPLLRDGGPAAAVAAASDDGRRWRVRLAGSLRWSDGSPLTAADAVRSAEQVAGRRRSGPASWLARDEPPVRAVGPDEVEYVFAVPTSCAPQVLGMPQFAPEPAAPATLGPYEVVERTGHQLVLAANPSAPGLPDRPDRLRFRLVPTAVEALRAYASGDLDITPSTSFGPAEAAALTGRPDLVARTIHLFGCLDLGRRSGWASAALRGAVHRMLDRLAVAAAAGPAAVPCWSPAHPDAAPPAPDRPGPAELAALRSAAPDGIRIDHADYAPNGEVVAAVAAQLSAALGRPVTTRAHSFPDYLRLAVSRDHDLLYTLTAPDFPHPAAVLAPWHSRAAQARHAGFGDAELDRRLDAALGCPDPAALPALWAGADERWTELAPRVPLLRVRAHLLCAPRLGGVELTADGLIPFENLVLRGGARD